MSSTLALMPFELPDYYLKLSRTMLPTFQPEFPVMVRLAGGGVAYRQRSATPVYHSMFLWPLTGWRRVTAISPGAVDAYTAALAAPEVVALGLEMLVRPWVQLGEADIPNHGIFALWLNQPGPNTDLSVLWQTLNRIQGR